MPLKTSVLGKKTLGIKWNGIKTNAEIYQIAEQPLVSKATQLRRRMLRTKTENLCYSRQEHVKDTAKTPFCWVSLTGKLTNVPLSWGTEQAEPCRWSVEENLSAPCLSLIVMVVMRTQQRPQWGVILNYSFQHLLAHNTFRQHTCSQGGWLWVGRKQLSACTGQSTDWRKE